MPYRLSGNDDDDDEDNDDHGANNLILGGNFSTLRSKQDHACVAKTFFRFLLFGMCAKSSQNPIEIQLFFGGFFALSFEFLSFLTVSRPF